jgi:hypothetical protein
MNPFNGEKFGLTRLCLQRAFGLLYLNAFLIALNQFSPLAGPHGLLPIHYFLSIDN